MTLTCRIDVMDTVRKVQKWATTASNAIDSEDGRLVEQVDWNSIIWNWFIYKYHCLYYTNIAFRLGRSTDISTL